MMNQCEKGHMQKKEVGGGVERNSPSKTAKSASSDEQASKERDARLSDELRQKIAKAAYYRAQARGFAPGYEEQDWLEAEQAVLKRSGIQSQ
jgi:hypothetical protein